MRRGLLLTTALLLTACGGGDDGKAAFVEDARAICDRAAEESKTLKTPTAPAEFAPYATSIVRIAEQAQKDLETLELPSDDADDLRSKVLEPYADVVAEGQAFV